MLSLSIFSNLFLKFATSYSELLETIQEQGKANPKPFNYLFDGSNRIYLPFIKSSSLALSAEDQKIIDILTAYKFTDIDYIKGYATSSDGRKFKILSALSKIENKLIKKAENQEKIDKIKLFFKKLFEHFTYSESRKLKNYDDLTVVISQDPIDVATMSTNRSWSSCMNLKKEKSFSAERLLCEVSSGGLVAYLIKSSDVDIKKPLARIWIRRFTNAAGESYAIPEEKIYGNATKDFYDFVKNWLEENQVYIEGELSLEGSSWSDTFSNKSHFNIPNFISEEEYLNLDIRRQNDTNVLLEIIKNHDKYSPEFIRQEIAPLFLNIIENLKKYPKEYFYLFNTVDKSDQIYSKFLTPFFINTLQENKDIKEADKILNIIKQNNLSDIEKKQKDSIKEFILHISSNGLDNIDEFDFSLLSNQVINLLNVCSEDTFNEIINVIYFAKELKTIPKYQYYSFVKNIFSIMVTRNIINFKLLSILKNDLIYLFNDDTYDTRLFLQAFENHPQKFKFMKNYIEKKIKSLNNPMIHINSIEQAYLDKLKKILQNM